MISIIVDILVMYAIILILSTVFVNTTAITADMILIRTLMVTLPILTVINVWEFVFVMTLNHLIGLMSYGIIIFLVFSMDAFYEEDYKFNIHDISVLP